jgi:hypothetical protein
MRPIFPVRSTGYIGSLPDRPIEFPATPISQPYDPHGPASDHNSSAGKKTRTKPIRNAEGILIRKDGRPDMRSVSSANNLRKVHGKKEAERTENDGETPLSSSPSSSSSSSSCASHPDHHHLPDDGENRTRSGTPMSGAAGDGDCSDDAAAAAEPQERHRELMTRMFPGHASPPEPDPRSERYFSRPSAPPRSDSGSGSERREDSHAAAADVVMVGSETSAERRPSHRENSGVGVGDEVLEPQQPVVAVAAVA